MPQSLSIDPKGSVVLSPTESIVAGSRGIWTFTYTAGAEGIAVGGSIRIWTPQHHSYRVRYFEWDLGQVDCWTDGQATVTAAVGNAGLMRFPAIYVFVAGRALLPGETLTILVGDTIAGGDMARAQRTAWKDLAFRAEVDLKGDGAYQELDRSPSLDVLPDAPASLVVVGPATPDVGQPFNLIVRVEDQYENVCWGYRGVVRLECTDPRADLTGECVFSEDDQGIARVRNCRLRTEGVHRITASEPKLQITGTSNPMQVGASPRYHIYLGDMHAQSGYHIRDLRYGTNADLYDYARQVQGLDFCAAVDLVSRFQESPDREAWWKQKLLDNKAANKPGQFVSILSYEWNSRDTGHRNVYFPGDNGPMYRYRHGPDRPTDDMWGLPDPSLNTPDDLQALLKGTGAITIPHHTNSDNDYSAEDLPRERRKHNWHPHDWGYGPYDNEMLIEIFQGRGSFETDHLSKWVVLGGFGSSVQDGLALGRRLGFVGGSDSHIGRTSPAIVFPNTFGTHGGLTFVLAEELTREAIFAALRARRTYATNGVRMIVWFEVNGVPMGGEVDLEDATTPRVVRCEAVGTDRIDRIEIIKNNEVAHTQPGAGESATCLWTDASPCTDGAYYYARVIQEDDGIAWASPIWVNLV